MMGSDLERRLSEYQVNAAEILSEVKDLTPQQIKHWIVSPLLVALGWDPRDKRQVFLDFPTRSGNEKADYALLDFNGQPRLLLEVYSTAMPAPAAAMETARKARAVGAPLALLTDGSEFSLWHVPRSESASPTPLLMVPISELAANADALQGLSAEYRLSDTGVEQLRRSAIRLAVLQILEENAEKTFDAMVDFVKAQIPPQEMDDSTEAAIRDATMLWLTEEHLALPAFGGNTPHRARDLRPTTVRDWEPFPNGPSGAFQYRYDTSKTLDVRQSAKEVKQALRVQGLKTHTATAFGGFYYALRQRAGLPPAREASGRPA
jgi:hypothetical protein